MESCSRIKDVNRRLSREDEVQTIWKNYFENLYNVGTQEQIAVHICDFNDVQKGDYFKVESIRRT